MSTFFHFSATVETAPVAARFTALGPVAGTTIAGGFTLESAVPSGDGEGCLSLLMVTELSFSTDKLEGDEVRGRETVVGAGEVDLRVTMGRVNGAVAGNDLAEEGGFDPGVGVDGDPEASETEVAGTEPEDDSDDGELADGVSNSTGRTLGVA